MLPMMAVWLGLSDLHASRSGRPEKGRVEQGDCRLQLLLVLCRLLGIMQQLHHILVIG